ncbi:MAG: hypothetical protein ACRDTC_11340 [Pseudonocardiaceae bacterium]
MISEGPTVYQTGYGLVRERLRGVLGAVVESGPGAEHVMGSVSWRVCAALYSLVEEHPVDRRGRCRSCRGPGALMRWGRRRCQVRVWACFWLHQPDETLLLGLLARELDQQPGPSPGAKEQADRSGSSQAASALGSDTTDVLPRIKLDRDDRLPQVPTVPCPPAGDGCPPARRSTPDTPTARSVGVRRSGWPSVVE